MNKTAAIPVEKLKTILGVLGGMGAGGMAGYHVTPRLGGYEDVESARRSAALMHALTGAIVGGVAGAGKLKPVWEGLGIKGQAMLGPGLLAEEALPMGLATMKRQQEASQAQTDASQASSIPAAVQNAFSSGTARGAGVGAAGAGIAALLSGLARRQTQEEMAKRKTRGSMIGSDFLKYVIPAMVAGGVVGSLHKGNSNGYAE